MASVIVHSSTILLFITLFINIEAQWAAEDDRCTTPDQTRGMCVAIKECPAIIEFLTNAPRPLSSAVRQKLASYQCGLSINTVKVCCPSGPISRGDAAGAPPDVSNHRNLGLVQHASCGRIDTGDRILNGNKTGLFEFPWMALIAYKTDRGLQYSCGGALINERYVLTAAHCITNLKNRRTLAGVRLGEHKISVQVDCETHQGGVTDCADPVQDMQIEEIIPHPEYNTATFQNDIGLLRLGRDANISVENVKPICLPIGPRITNPTLTKVTVTGWGQTEKEGQSDELLKVDILTVSQDECQKLYGRSAMITHKHICAGGKNNTDSCAGDSGGPLQKTGEVHGDVRYIQYGVVSFGPVPCGITGRPGVYTKIAYYVDWILNNIKS